MKKNLLLISLILGTLLLLMVSSVSAATATFHPQDGEDATPYGGTYDLTTSDLGDVEVSDNDRYYSKDTWEWSYYNDYEYIDFSDFEIDLPNDAVIDSVTLNFEWQRGCGISASRIQVWDDSISNWHSAYDLTMPDPNTDQMITRDLTPYITTEEDFEDLVVRFQAHNHEDPACSDKKKTKHDLVEIEVEYHLPECSLTITNPEEGDWFDSEVVPIDWVMGGSCFPFDEFHIWYLDDGTCDVYGNWKEIAHSLDPSSVANPAYPDYQYIWDSPPASGQYCVKVKLTSNGIVSYSELFNVDLAKPVVHLSVGTPQIGDCTEGTGDCYVTKNTKITLTCTDDDPQAPWQSGPSTIKYKINGGSEQTYSSPFEFAEDSNHELEYWCYDGVEKESLHKIKNFFVNSEGPTIEKTVSQPKVSAEWGDFDWYVNGDTKLCLTTIKGNSNHETPGDVTLECGYDWWINFGCTQFGGHEDVTLDQDGCFSYAENSFHVLSCTATDALGNIGMLTEKDIVNLQAPTTILHFNGPYYFNKGVQWIDTVSTISFTVVKGNPGHPVPGDVTTYYRYQQVDDSWCYGTSQDQWQETSKEEQGWMTYEGPFGLPESCYAVEYYSIDPLTNSEDVNVKFVFSDHTAPELDLSVGESGKNCDNPFVSCEPEWDWKVTMDTPITISCVDQEPHPSGVKEICYTILWDGSEVSPTTECVSADSVTFEFTESCVHTVEYTCTDNVDKQSSGSAVFKVIGEDFPISLDKKWNLISVPVNLLSNNIEEVFGDDENIEEVWSYEGGIWKVYYPDDPLSSTLTTIVPGKGYWVKTSGSTSLIVGGSLFEEAVVPNSVSLDNGWNLIGHYGVANKPAYCSLFSLVDTQQGFPRWSALVGYNSASKQFYGLNSADMMLAGKGYWIEMDVEDNYNYATQCWGFNPI